MDILTAKAHTNELCFYRDRDLPAAEPMQVRILGTSERFVRISVQLDGSKATTPDECFSVDPSELHLERSGFEDPHDTDPAPTTPRSEPSAPVTDRFLSIEIIRARR